MALINEQTVNAELFKVDYSILALGVIEFVELCLDTLAGFHKLLDRELFALACLHIVNATLNIVVLLSVGCLSLSFFSAAKHRFSLILQLCTNMTTSIVVILV